MKKILKIVLAIGLLFQNFAYIPRVFANTVADLSLGGIVLKQDGNVLQMEDGAYVAPSYSPIDITFTIDGYESNGVHPVISIRSQYNYCITTAYYGYNNETKCNPTFTNEVEEYTFAICGVDDWSCEEVYATYTFNVKYEKYSDMQDDLVYITEINQGGHVVEPDEYSHFDLNNLQDIIFNVTGENLDPTANYSLMCSYTNNAGTTFTGSQIMNGVSYTCSPTDYQYLYFMYQIGGYSETLKYDTGDGIDYPSISIVTDNTIGSYEDNLVYTNYPNVEVLKESEYIYSNDYYYVINSKYANEDNTLSYHIDGTNYQNKLYDVVITITGDNNFSYTKTESVNGTELNNGYDVELTDLSLGTTNGATYTMKTTIDYVSKTNKLVHAYSERDFTINKITQGDSTLTLSNGVYVAPGYEKFKLYLDIEDYDPDKETFYIDAHFGSASSTREYVEDEGFEFEPDFRDEVEDLTVYICSDWQCDHVVSMDSFKIRLANYNLLAEQVIYLYDIYQGGEKIEPDEYFDFYFNDKQTIYYKVKGENLIPDATYTISNGNYEEKIQVSGSQLASGITGSHTTSLSDYMYFTFKIGEVELNEYYYDGKDLYLNGENDYYFGYNIDEPYDKEYTASLKYKNYPSVAVATNEDEDAYYDIYYISSEYHNSNNPLLYHISGSGYENKNYEVIATVLKDGDEEIWKGTYTVSGNAINNGTADISLNGLVLPTFSDPDDINSEYGMPFYTFGITIDDVYDYQYARYNLLGKNVYVNPEIFFENGKKNLSVFRGFGNSGIYDTNESVFTKYSNIYINFRGEEFNDDDEYEYIVQYGYMIENDGEEEDDVAYPETLSTGTISGETLNNVGLFMTLDNHNHYDNPSYRFIVKKDNVIVAYTAPIIYTIKAATLGNVSLSAHNRNLYLKTDDYSYIATKNMPIDIEVSGLGFNEEKDYDFTFCYMSLYQNDEYSDDHCKEVTFSGAELNSGSASLTVDEEIDKDAIKYSLYLYGEGKDYFGQGGFEISFVENSDLLPQMTRYILDDISDIIKNIKKNTSVTGFIQNIEVADNGSIKVFDKTGQTEITGTVGTGMLGRVIDEYNHNVIDIDIAVQGDTTGDGSISITDLVQTKQHLADIKELTGVYAVAADVSGTGTVSFTDLLNMGKDVAGIEELD